MTPSLSIPTDNIYKFTCLFGLALIIVSIMSYVSLYTASLDRKVKYVEVIIPLEARAQRNKAEDDLLTMNKKLLEITGSNEKSANVGVGAVLGVGIVLSALGASRWYSQIQLRDDKLAKLQIEKLEAEVSKLRAETVPKNLSGSVSVASSEEGHTK